MKAKISLEGLSDKKITILHNGEVHIAHEFDRNFDIVKFYEERYNKNIEIYPLKSMAQIKTLNDIKKKE